MPNWPRDEVQQFDKTVAGLSPEVQLPEQALAILRKNLKKSEPALIEARRLADLPYGRFPINYSADGFSTPYPHVRAAREVAELLKHDAMRRSAEGDIDGALASGRGILNAGRSMCDEPSMINITDNPTIAGADLGFRLWDVNRRRQPAKKGVAPK